MPNYQVKNTNLENLKAGDIIAQDTNIDDERELIANNPVGMMP